MREDFGEGDKMDRLCLWPHPLPTSPLWGSAQFELVNLAWRDVIPAQAGIHPEVYPTSSGCCICLKMDSGLRRNDTVFEATRP